MIGKGQKYFARPPGERIHPVEYIRLPAEARLQAGIAISFLLGERCKPFPYIRKTLKQKKRSCLWRSIFIFEGKKYISIGGEYHGRLSEKPMIDITARKKRSSHIQRTEKTIVGQREKKKTNERLYAKKKTTKQKKTQPKERKL